MMTPEMAMECSKLNQGLSEEIQGSHQQGGPGQACTQPWKDAWNIEPGGPYNTMDNILYQKYSLCSQYSTKNK